jgi:UDP-N-acetylmuramate dehydrogenase
MLTQTPLYNALTRVAQGNVFCSVPLSEKSYWKIGGNVDYFVEPKSIQQLADVRKVLNEYPNTPNMIIGDASNLLFDDEGFRGVIVKIGNNLDKITFERDRVYCDAGVWVPGLAYKSYRKGLSGLEHTCGIPGRLGGLIYMNGGSNRQSISENLESVTLIDIYGNVITHDTKALGFSYRESPFQNNKNIIAGATLKLNVTSVAEVRSAMRKVLSSRRKKFPRKLPNCGSVFVSNPKMYEVIGPPGFAIEKVGLKGIQKGNAQISNLHANFIVNLGGATSNDVLYLIALARSKVYENTQFLMDCEARYVSPLGNICQAHVKANELFL